MGDVAAARGITTVFASSMPAGVHAKTPLRILPSETFFLLTRTIASPPTVPPLKYSTSCCHVTIVYFPFLDFGFMGLPMLPAGTLPPANGGFIPFFMWCSPS